MVHLFDSYSNKNLLLLLKKHFWLMCSLMYVVDIIWLYNRMFLGSYVIFILKHPSYSICGYYENSFGSQKKGFVRSNICVFCIGFYKRPKIKRFSQSIHNQINIIDFHWNDVCHERFYYKRKQLIQKLKDKLKKNPENSIHIIIVAFLLDSFSIESYKSCF